MISKLEQILVIELPRRVNKIVHALSKIGKYAVLAADLSFLKILHAHRSIWWQRIDFKFTNYLKLFGSGVLYSTRQQVSFEI